MKNLQVCELNRIDFPETVTNVQSVVQVDRLIFFVEDGKVCYFIPEHKIHHICKRFLCITDLEYVVSLEYLWFGTGNEFIFVSPKTLEYRVVEARCVYVAAAWSPNQEYIAVCEADSRVKCYRDIFYHLTEHLSFLDETNDPLTDNVSDLKAEIAWKQNSNYFAVSYFDGNYKLRVYGVNGQIVKKLLNFPNMLPHITWRQSMFVCCRVDEDQRFWIRFYEKNGLLCSEFPLDENITDVRKIQWSEAGDMLAALVNTKNGTLLNVYSPVDCSYKLKQQLCYRHDNPLTTFTFVNTNKHIANLVVANRKNILSTKYISKIQHGLLPNGVGFIGEVDGNLLNLRRINGDPFAGLREPIQIIRCENPINRVIFNHSFKQCVIYDSHSNMFLHTFINGQFREDNGRWHGADYYNFCFTTENTMAAMYLNPVNTHDLYEINLLLNEMLPLRMHEKVNYMMYIPELHKLLKLKPNKVLYLNESLFLKNVNFDIYKMEYAIIDTKLYVFALDVMDNLLLNNHNICTNVSSFILHDSYLYITTLKSELHCIHLNSQNLEKALNDEASGMEIYTRSCEEGSVLLCGVTQKKHVVLYHTRGNTEIILCRNIALQEIEAFLSEGNWREAFEYIRVERLDFNLLVDMNPDRFLRSIDEVINTLTAPNFLLQFLLNLSDENVLETTYKDVRYPNIHSVADKKKVVCQAILDVTDTDIKKYIKVNVLTAYYAGGVSKSIEVLYFIFKTYEDVDSIIAEGVNCLNLYAPADDIRKACLSKVDIDFVQCIFGKLNVDPKVHDRLFTEVRENDKNEYRQFFIVHDFIENYKTALHYLVANCMHQIMTNEAYDDEGDLTEMIDYAEAHEIFSTLYKYCQKHDFLNRQIVTVYTDKLLSSRRYEEAGLIFTSNHMWEEALDAYTKCKMWKEVMYIITKLDVDKTQHIAKLAKSLQDSRNYKDAAHLYDQYLSDPEHAVNALVYGKFFKDAVLICRKYDRADIETTIRPEYTTYYETLLEKVQSTPTLFENYCDRIQILRAAEWANILKSKKEIPEVTHEYAESAASSSRGSSLISSSTQTTRGRKDDRRKQDLREGGFYENIALLRILHTIVSEAYTLCADIRDMCSLYVLCETDGLEKAKILQDAHAYFLDKINKNISIIWPPELNAINAPITPQLMAIRRNLDDLDMKYRYPPELSTRNWRLNLLDEIVDVKRS